MGPQSRQGLGGTRTRAVLGRERRGGFQPGLLVGSVSRKEGKLKTLSECPDFALAVREELNRKDKGRSTTDPAVDFQVWELAWRPAIWGTECSLRPSGSRGRPAGLAPQENPPAWLGLSSCSHYMLKSER